VKLYLDANVIIYGHEADENLKLLVLSRLARWFRETEGEVMTSGFSRLECRSIPLRNRDLQLLADYDDFFAGDAVQIVEVSREVIDKATDLRAKYGFKSPDAIHVATALHANATRFLTADVALARCQEIEVEIIRPIDRPPLAHDQKFGPLDP
jgi:uncharacterized protein